MTERYKNGKIYTIRYKNDDNLIYVGSTCLQLHKRFYTHKNRCFNERDKEYNKILYKKIRETNNINDWYIELFENFPTENKELLLKREGEIIREIGTLNKEIAGRTNKEYIEDNKENKKEYYKENKKQILEHQKEYYKDNKDIIKEKCKQYYESNKTKISERKKTKIICPCGCDVRKSDLKKHQRSIKHNQLLKEQEHNIIQ